LIIISEDDVGETDKFYFRIHLERKRKRRKPNWQKDEQNCLDEDIKEVERNHSHWTDSAFSIFFQ